MHIRNKRWVVAVTLVGIVASCSLATSPAVIAQEVKRLQTEKEFQELMPISGEVETFFGKFELDHSFPTKEQPTTSTN